MSDIVSMRERRMMGFNTRRKHVDDLLARASELTDDGPEHVDSRAHLDELTKAHGRLGIQLDALKQKDFEDWEEEQVEHDGPMGIWDALAEQAEKLVEKLESHTPGKPR